MPRRLADLGLRRPAQGYNPFESTIGPANVAQLRHLWSVDLGATINASPIVATDIDVAGTPTDLVYTETEHGELFAVKTTGQILWQRSLGVIQTNCPDTPDKQFGVSAPVVFDRGGNRVFVAGGDGYVYALEAATATSTPSRRRRRHVAGLARQAHGRPAARGRVLGADPL